MTLDEAQVGKSFTIREVGGDRMFRRRLLEFGLIPGTSVSVQRVAPLGDPLELSARGASVSIRRNEARAIQVLPLEQPEAVSIAAPVGVLLKEAR